VSQREILTTVNALLVDAAVGLRAKTEALAAESERVIAVDYRFVKWALAGKMQTSTQPNVMTRPVRWQPDAKNEGRPHRDATAQLEIGYEYFGADPEDIQENVTIAATALAQVLDELAGYSLANAGTVYDVVDPIDFQFGQFSGPVSNGFIARVTVLERSSE
jgi:hypothetical protein